MKRILFIAVLAIALALGMGGIAMANYGPHGGYLADTDACAGCHRAHVAFSDLTWQDSGGQSHNALLVSAATTMKDFCYACHGNAKPGAATNVQGGVLDTAISGDTQAQGNEVGKILNGGGFSVVGYGNSAGTTRPVGPDATATINVSQRAATSQHDVDGTGSWETTGGGSTIWGSWGPGSNNGPGSVVDLTCTNCHDPHGSSNYRLLLDSVQGRTVGGYTGDFASDVDPTPAPWVISNEIGYPNGATSPDLGWRLHKNTWEHMDGVATDGEYMPDYTNAAYARPASGAMNGTQTNKGMTGWCTRACHDQYIVKAGNLENPAGNNPGPEDFGTENFAAGTYNPGDGSGARHRHRHPVNVPLLNWGPAGSPLGDRDLVIDPMVWVNWDADIKFVDIPLLHNPDDEGQGSPYNTYDGTIDTGDPQANSLSDGLDCLTCHRAHGSAAIMTGYAGSGSNISPSKTDGNLGTPPTYDSALLRADNRGVCERCHNK